MVRIIQIVTNELIQIERIAQCVRFKIPEAIVHGRQTDVIIVTREICFVSLLQLFDCTQRSEPLS